MMDRVRGGLDPTAVFIVSWGGAMGNKAAVVALGLSLTLLGALGLRAQPPKEGEKGKQAVPKEVPKPGPDQDTPEKAFRAFYVAMQARDLETMRRTSLPAEDLELLASGRPPVPAKSIEPIRDFINSIGLRQVKPGETVRQLNGTVVTVKPEQVGPDHVIILMDGSGQLVDVQRVKGAWYVDPRLYIKARREMKPSKGPRRPPLPGAPKKKGGAPTIDD
jgi:hypothetical protein